MSGAESRSDFRSGRDHNVYLNLRNGINLGPWRLRNYSTYSTASNAKKWNSITTYLQRDIKPLKSQLVVGESYTPSEVFDGFSFKGVQLYSDDSMQPESMRGFAPVVRGIAQSNAQVTIRQDGNVIWQSYVSPGPFSIKDLYPTSASGDLEVSVREADGTVRRFIQPFSSVPIMQREGRLKYTLALGKYNGLAGNSRKPEFMQSTLTYGLPGAATVYGGSLLARNYQAADVGVCKGLGEFGSVSLDGTFAATDFDTHKKQGGSFRFQYSKDIAMSGTTLTLAGYRYSTSGYYGFDEANGYYDRVPHFSDPDSTVSEEEQEREQQAYSNWRALHNKRSKIQLNINQTLNDYGSLYLSAYEQQFWGLSARERSVNFGYSNSYNGISYSLNYASSKTPYLGGTDNVVSLLCADPV
ncbi:MAG: putative outer membrane usher protein ElfC [Candidatus Erwinia impunctatus]